MLKQWNHLYLARICVEADTPLSIQTGQSALNFDTSLVRDASGLPALPSTSIRGVLRHLFQDQYDEATTHELFGYALVNDSNEKEDKTSRIQISWGVLHNHNNQPVQPRELPHLDPDFLEELAQSQPIKRERVRLNHLGCAEDQGKFDVTACPKGVRFSFEIKYWSETAQDDNWDKLLQILSQPSFRLGHSTRSGFGALSIQSLHSGQFDLTNPTDAQTWRALSRALDDTRGLNNTTLSNSSTDQSVTYHIPLTAEGCVRIGGGDLPVHTTSDEPSDLRMQSERYINWHNNKGKLSDRVVPLIPSSAVKGAIAHRLVFHSNLRKNQFADSLSSQDLQNAASRHHHEDLIALLGSAKGEATGNEEENLGQVGQLIIDDIYLPENAPTMQLWHNRIDRFTGGVIDGALFTEEVLYEPSFTLTLTLTKPNLLSSHAKQVLQATIDDLCQGRLAIGAGGSRGLGACHGEPVSLFSSQTEGA